MRFLFRVEVVVNECNDRIKRPTFLIRKKTEYKQDYAPEVLEAFDNKHPEMITGYVSTARSSQVCVLLPDSRTLPKYVSATFLI